jgi:hypothetical protein
MFTILILMITVGAPPPPSVTVEKPRAVKAAGGVCRIAEEGTLGVNIGPDPKLPILALTIGPGSAMADMLHANKAKFTGPGKYANEIIAVYLGKTALEDAYMGLGTVTIAADGKSGRFALNDGTASGSFDCGAPPVK